MMNTKGINAKNKNSRAAPENKNGKKRYNVVLQEELFNELQKVADEANTSVIEMLRKFIKLGLLAVQIEKTPGSALIIKEGDTERQIILL